MQGFRKRSYNFKGFIRDVANVVRNGPSIMKTMTSKRISPQFAERIMLAVTGVNGCVYCSYMHSKMALESGCTMDGIEDVMCGDFEGCAPDELVALTFAQHFAESKNNPSKVALRKLVECYGLARSQDIINYISMISIGNLAGNSIDAFESRLRGEPAVNGSALFEFMAYFFGGFLFKKVMQKENYQPSKKVKN